jgi:hypothetical protein
MPTSKRKASNEPLSRVLKPSIIDLTREYKRQKYNSDNLKYIIIEFFKSYKSGDILIFHYILDLLYKSSIDSEECKNIFSKSYELYLEKQMIFNNFYILLFRIAIGMSVIPPDKTLIHFNLKQMDKEIKELSSKIFINLLKYDCRTIVSSSNINPEYIINFLENINGSNPTDKMIRSEQIFDNKAIIISLHDMIIQDKEITESIQDYMLSFNY